jgi:hypothetical protein
MLLSFFALPTRAAAHRDVFSEYGVQIMTATYEGDSERPRIVPKDQQWYAAPARRLEGPGG